MTDNVENWVEEPQAIYGTNNAEMNLAWEFIANTGVSVFLTGKAGTGKTTFLKRLREAMPKRMIVLAPTGVAAINAGGQTIHSFFQIAPGPFIPGTTVDSRKNLFSMSQRKKDLIRTLDLLVIDEVSMVRADLLDNVDHMLRQYRDRYKPFGGVQLLLIGDLMQLSPVSEGDEWRMLAQYYPTPYFFSSTALQSLKYVTIELTHIYRQSDQEFIDLLAHVRAGDMSPAVVDALNQRYIPGFCPEEQGWISLTTHNRSAQILNDNEFAKLQTPPVQFEAEIEGNFPESIFPTEQILSLKVGAQVMFVKNDPGVEHRYFNGKIGTVADIDTEKVVVRCEDEDIEVGRLTWENTKYTLDEVSKEIKEKVEGKFTQFPLRLAWAITVHKSQGLTFDKAMLDINLSFAHGQVYVALSRCRSLQGLVLTQPIAVGSVITDLTVNSYIDHARGEIAENAQRLPSFKYEYALALLDELYGFNQLEQDLGWLIHIVERELNEPALLAHLHQAQTGFATHIKSVGMRFRQQYLYLMQITGGRLDDASLIDRIKKSALYFYPKIKEILMPILKSAVINITNKQLMQKYNNALQSLRGSIDLKMSLFEHLCQEPFSTHAYLNIKAKRALGATAKLSNRSKSRADTAAQSHQGNQPKAKKVETVTQTLELYRQGKKPEEIAKERKLTVNTIYSHFAKLVAEGLVSCDELVAPERQKAVMDVMKTFEGAYTLTEVKEQLPEDYTFNEIRLVVSKSATQT